MQTSKDQGIIHLPTASISFMNFLIFSKILVFTSLQEVFKKSRISKLYLLTLENSEEQPLEHFSGLPWSQYLHSMTERGTHNDNITLQAASNLYNIELQMHTH